MQRMLANPHRKLLRDMWKRCWNDAKSVFQQSCIAVVQRDIEAALPKCEAGLEQSCMVAVLPKNPTQLLTPANLVLVEFAVRPMLLAVYRKQGATAYMSELSRHQLWL
ncbi:MAG: hypothetical protein CMF24_08805 [Ilumatobacter sp.]|nr:hypothetical protein [Ilumatobacter sp.]